jgi:hypothetical protein
MILFFLPLSIVMLIVSEMLFQYRNPGTARTKFSRLLFFLLIGVFLFFGICLSLADQDIVGDTGNLMFLWEACTSIVIAIFVMIPAHKLIAAISFPVVQTHDAQCLRFSRIALGLFAVDVAYCFLYNVLAFFGQNPMQNSIVRDMNGPQLLGRTRFFVVFHEFLSKLFPSILSMCGVIWVRQQDLEFATDSFYQQGHM